MSDWLNLVAVAIACLGVAAAYLISFRSEDKLLLDDLLGVLQDADGIARSFFLSEQGSRSDVAHYHQLILSRYEVASHLLGILKSRFVFSKDFLQSELTELCNKATENTETVAKSWSPNDCLKRYVEINRLYLQCVKLLYSEFHTRNLIKRVFRRFG